MILCIAGDIARDIEDSRGIVVVFHCVFFQYFIQYQEMEVFLVFFRVYSPCYSWTDMCRGTVSVADFFPVIVHSQTLVHSFYCWTF